MVFSVRVNGTALRALLDTGAQRSVLRTEAALRAGMPRTVLRAPPIGTAQGVGAASLPVRA